jgi:hypothetical protein
MLHNKLLRAVQAYLLGFSTSIMLSWKGFCSFCPFHTSLFVTGCLAQLVSIGFPNRVINRPLQMAGLLCYMPLSGSYAH